ncbi:MAG: type II secretion system protein GspH [Lentisphaerae bacterium GWF2_44_16]|nr:MAG: type II secretion system protein GspH [Lentisphaerae bacterium GWF2_44_16]
MITNGFRYAFTLLEMLVVLLIMGIMAAIAAPSMANFYQNVNLKSSVQRFRLFLDTARMQAIFNHNDCRLIIHPGWRRIDMEIKKSVSVKNPSEALKYVKSLEAQGDGANKNGEFTPVEGAFARMDVPNGVNIKHISISGVKKDPIEKIVITFSDFYQPDEINFVFENTLKDYLGLQLEAGCGTVRNLQVINRD